jgi:hypothetical protein
MIAMALRIENQPPYLHDGRLLTRSTKLTGEEKRDLVAFLRTL